MGICIFILTESAVLYVQSMNSQGFNKDSEKGLAAHFKRWKCHFLLRYEQAPCRAPVNVQMSPNGVNVLMRVSPHPSSVFRRTRLAEVWAGGRFRPRISLTREPAAVARQAGRLWKTLNEYFLRNFENAFKGAQVRSRSVKRENCHYINRLLTAYLYSPVIPTPPSLCQKAVIVLSRRLSHR